jgi:TatD DNase family protein
MRDVGVGTITIGTDVEDSKKAVALAEENENIYASIGVHPADDAGAIFDEAVFEKLAESEKVVAVGECGLEYFNLTGDIEVEKNRQKELFAQHIAFAQKHNLPLMIHARPTKGSMDAYRDVLEMLKTAREKAPVRANFHFFAGDMGIAKDAIEIGFTLSFTGVITFARQYDEVIRFAPSGMIMAETDSPYVAPVPYRGKRNEPTFVSEVVKTMAEIRGGDVETVRVQLLKNVKRVFIINMI